MRGKIWDSKYLNQVKELELIKLYQLLKLIIKGQGLELIRPSQEMGLIELSHN